MTTREFADVHGIAWRAWDVHPDDLERRLAADPLLRPAIERRRRVESRIRVTNPLMSQGWLAFEARGERRRLAPVPPGWEDMDDTQLRGLLERAVPIDRPHRVIE
jgi:hypothetical protein